ncbi:hypothetical protein ACJMK2_021538 [Sinanodonta woodiana]|uniref:Uncharacterized protein n=1 Tax=Sinanodonta woodiana TaxID=1069815 RepID=A0ABD3THB2_SINWO
MRNISIMLSVLLIAIHCVQGEDHSNATDHILPLSLSKSKDFTAGNSECRWNEKCGYHGDVRYSWCYTDYSDSWDYCCTSQCDFDEQNYKTCISGNTRQYCGQSGEIDIQGRPCLENHPCGVHTNDLRGSARYYWCYVDLNENWDFCCAPHSPCEKRSSSYTWCQIDVSKAITFWKPCKPVKTKQTVR